MPTADLSVILVNKFGLARLRRVLAALAAQSIAGRLEVAIVSPFDGPLEERWPFAAVRYVKFDPVLSLGPLRAAGVFACSAPFLVFGEDHCFPQPGWAAALLDRLRDGWTGVGPSMTNHNPATWTSRADWLMNYASFSPDRTSGQVNYIAPHNSAYSTAVLQGFGAELPELLQMDHLLQARLLSAGGRLYFEPAAQTTHANLSRTLIQLVAQFVGSRVYGGIRASSDRWPAYRRGIYAAAFPAIAALRLIRACALVRDWRSLPVVPLLAIAALYAGVGEACGYLFGAGSALLHRANEELGRFDGVIDSERHLLLP